MPLKVNTYSERKLLNEYDLALSDKENYLNALKHIPETSILAYFALHASLKKTNLKLAALSEELEERGYIYNGEFWINCRNS